MIKIIIADDELIFREYLRNLIDWEQYGFEICYEAKNGIEAFDLIIKHKPEIALVDINMPYLDGMGLIEKLSENSVLISVILITGHSEFEYARKAVKLGVIDYILKPFDKEELLITLLKIKSTLQKQNVEKDMEKSNRSLMKERFLNLLISGEMGLSEEDIKKQLEFFDLPVAFKSLQAASIEIDNMYSLWNDANDISLWKFAVSNILYEIISTDTKPPVVFNGPEGRIICVIEYDNSKDDENYYLEKFLRVCDLVRKYLKFSITIGIGNPKNSYRHLRASYLESLVALQNKLVFAERKVILNTGLDSESMSIGLYPNEINEKLILALRTNDYDEVSILLNDVFGYIKRKKLSFDYIAIIIMGLVSLCLSYINEIGKNIDQVLGKDFSPYNEIKNKPSLDELFKWCHNIFETVLKISDDRKNTKSKKIVDSVKEYIEENYPDSEISVEGIANRLFINSSYLRKIFKKELNMSVNDFIVELRLKKAKDLIGTGNIRLSDISNMVGYNDAGYFSKSFKKRFGLSPSEYENMKN